MSCAASLRSRRSGSARTAGFRVVVLVALLCLLLQYAAPAMAKDCVVKGPGNMIAWKHDQGSFQCINCFSASGDALKKGTGRRQWNEYDRDRRLLNSFTEGSREGAQLVLHDEARDVFLLLRPDLCGIRTGKEQNFRQLYGGTFMSVIDCT
ncbi:hypothetical protein ABL78_7181 [Leptomonas seymouri]|uniref:Uncharacterized protein n=1 Tax=Leptomonas seymouri TaxID=5684 RepID=A0A0N1HSR8_LEPSE|nr:hypothetical protein ABL78_7181 [Leptomonas seymouri]|eukprot:KPI83781.1 hypothetical protein ABL78_7181 [Leptomonas seymouri]